MIPRSVMGANCVQNKKADSVTRPIHQTQVSVLTERRLPLEIMAEILNLCKQPQTKTRIMYRTNLSYTSLQKYLAQLQSLELLQSHSSITRCSTTPKGYDFLTKWSLLKALL